MVLPHALSLSDSTGTDGAQIYYADELQLIVGGGFFSASRQIYHGAAGGNEAFSRRGLDI